MVNTNRIDIHILNFISIIIFNIGAGALAVGALDYSNVVTNLIWIILVFFGNFIIINIEVFK